MNTRTKKRNAKPKGKPRQPRQKKKILFVAAEAAPFIRTGGLGDVAGALPKALVKAGMDVRVVIPLYSDIPDKLRQTLNFVTYTYVPLAWRNQYCGVYEGEADGVKYYFIDNEYYFKRGGLYGHYDDGERFAFFSKAVLEMLMLIDFRPSVIHCNDWQTALVPVFLDCFYRGNSIYAGIKTVYSIHNIEFQGQYDTGMIGDVLGIPDARRQLLEYAGCCNYMKGGIECADRVTTVSPTYAGEIMDSYYAYGLEDILRKRSYKISGILNGIDTTEYDPMTDKALFASYGVKDMSGKSVNKEGMLRMISLQYVPTRPLIAMISRLTSQKGLDLLLDVAEELLAADVQLVILGMGDWKYETRLKDLEHRYGNKLRVIINFSKDLASKLYAASDIFLMPSKFEPCGLSQMIAMRYGSVPVVRETGGLKDTVPAYNPEIKEGFGYTFKTFNAQDMLGAIWRAVDTYYNRKDDWDIVVKNDMTGDFSWSRSAKSYADLYRSLK